MNMIPDSTQQARKMASADNLTLPFFPLSWLSPLFHVGFILWRAFPTLRCANEMGKSMASSGDKHKEEAEKIRALIAQHLQDAQKLLSPLEDYVMFQVKNNCYDFDANRHLLRSYLLYPDTIKVRCTGVFFPVCLLNVRARCPT